MRSWVFLLSLGLLACGDDDVGVDAGSDASMDAGFDAAGPMDAGPFDDAELVDAAPDDADSFDAGDDAGIDPDDAGDDAGLDDAGAGGDAMMIPGFGTIVGGCGRIAGEIDATTPSFFEVRFDFADDAYDAADESRLTAGAQEILNDGTAGGSSALSEALAYEVLARCENARMLVASETEVAYSSEEARTDFVALFDENVGVSVARAFLFPGTSPYPLSEAQRVIGRKLDDIPISTANAVTPTWDKQILAVLAWDDVAAMRVREAWDGFTAERRADTIVYVIVTDGRDRAVYNLMD